jgi:hypothetical protein
MRDYSGSSRLVGWAALAAVLVAACSAPVRQPQPVAPPVVERASPPALPAPPPPKPVVVREDAPLRYVVQPGDTLWHISRRFLAEPWQWPEVWFVNDQIANPHLIYPGDVLTLVMRDGRPQVVRDDGDTGDRLLKLGPQVRELALDQAIPTIPIDAIRDFLDNPRLIDAEELKRAPYLLAFAEDQLIAGADTPAYVRNLPPDADYRWAVVRPDVPVVDPETRDTLGFAATPVGALEIREFTEPAALAWLTRTEVEARIGDRLVSVADDGFDPRFFPRAPESVVDGTIIWLAEQRLQATQYQVVALNRGRAHGIETGHLLTILQRGREVDDPYAYRDVTLPQRAIGEMMVFKVGERLSFGLVLEATRPVTALDRVESPRRL